MLCAERFLMKRNPVANYELISRLRTATVADSAESLYQLMTDAADIIERQHTQLENSLNEIERLNELVLRLVMIGTMSELGNSSVELKEHE